MTVRVKTSALVELLTDLAFTADDPGSPVGAILLHTASGYPDGTQPGRSTLLVGTSTDRFIIGHTWCVAEGAAEPMLWPVLDATAVVSVFRPLAKGNPDHAVEIRRSDDEITVQEDGNLFGEGTSLRFTLADIGEYPRATWGVLQGTGFPDKAGDPAVPRTDIAPERLAALAKIGNRRKAPVEMYRCHQRQPTLIQIGGSYRGAVFPVSWYSSDGDPRRDGMAPSTDLYAPVLPPVEDLPRAEAVTVDV